jgi:glycosyltransferase involved in cell wall biosynthesis
MTLRIGILGTRGIPNHYGGFEQFAAYLSEGLAAKGHEVTVYNPHDHPYTKNEWNGVQVVHCYDPARWMGSAGQFIYDLNCIRDARKKKFDILLVLGYTSSSVWGRLYPQKSSILTNMDGLEWKRSKYTAPVKKFLLYAEKLAIRFSDRVIADSLPIRDYLDKKFKIQSTYISYGAEIPMYTDEKILSSYQLVKDDYFLLIARMEPENNIETILQGVCNMGGNRKIVVIGNVKNSYGRKLLKQFGSRNNVFFMGTVYSRLTLDTLRANCLLYFHGHSVGGTNPSLLEAMACGALVCAHDNVFNRAVIGDDAFYFQSAEQIATFDIADIKERAVAGEMILHNLAKITHNHAWSKIVDGYEQLFMQACQNKK